MKSTRSVALSALLTITVFCAVLYSSCSKKETADPCSTVTCQNGGTCAAGVCTCTTGYEGTFCDTLSRTKFLKSWSAVDVIGSTTLPYTATIGASTSTDVTKVVIGLTFSDNFFTIGPINATVSGTTITIPNQNPDGNKYSVSGTGTLANGKITWSYTIKDDNTSATQIYSGVWQ